METDDCKTTCNTMPCHASKVESFFELEEQYYILHPILMPYKRLKAELWADEALQYVAISLRKSSAILGTDAFLIWDTVDMAEAEADKSGTYRWNIPPVSEDEYYITVRYSVRKGNESYYHIEFNSTVFNVKSRDRFISTLCHSMML